MAYKEFYVEDNGEEDIDRSNFTKKLHEAGYSPVRSITLVDNTRIDIYDINDTGIMFETGVDKHQKESGIGNITTIGNNLENILKTKDEIEGKTGFVLEEVK